MISINSANFGFLKTDSPQLVRLGALAEHYFQEDPNTCLIKLRQFGELFAQTTAAQIGIFTSPDKPQADLLRRLKLDSILPGETADLFHQLRIAGNRASHHQGGKLAPSARTIAGMRPTTYLRKARTTLSTATTWRPWQAQCSP
jgi:type I restriction enzyme R subunit